MFKRRNKEGGFTLIELMIVIAVIGILAVVLIPRLGGVKDSAKYAGVTTNAKSVEAFVVANIDRWEKNKVGEETIKTAITTSNPELANPFDEESAKKEPLTFDSENIDKGIVHVDITGAGTSDLKIVVTGYGNVYVEGETKTGDVVYISTVEKDGKITVGK